MADIALIGGSPSFVSRSAAILTFLQNDLTRRHLSTHRIDVRALPAEHLLHANSEGIVKLLVKLEGLARLRHQERAVGAFQRVLDGQLHPGYFIPGLEPAVTFGTVLVRFEPMAPWAEVLPNRPQGSEEALGVPC